MFHHNLSPNLILGYHGCDKSVGQKLLRGKPFKPSQNDYDWLGPGIYFWEANPERAKSFAIEQQKRGRIREPFVVGAALTLGNCIDTLNEANINAIRIAHEQLKSDLRKQGKVLPQNTGKNKVLKRLDCAVIVRLHELAKKGNLQPADSVRGLYYEGAPVYRTSAFYAKSHCQICIINPECIKGVFLPRL